MFKSQGEKLKLASAYLPSWFGIHKARAPSRDCGPFPEGNERREEAARQRRESPEWAAVEVCGFLLPGSVGATGGVSENI